MQLGRNNPLLGCLHATGKTIVNKRFPPPEPCLPFLMLFVLPCMSFVCPVYAFSFCSVLFSSLFFFFRWLFCKEKVTKKHRNFVCVDACTPPPAPKVPPPSPLCFPTTLWSIFALISPFPVLYKARIFGPIFYPQKVLAFCTPTKVPPTLPMLPPQPCVIPSLSLNVLRSFPYL